MHNRNQCQGSRCRRGAAAVELAVVLPFLLFVLVVAVDFGRVFYFSVTIENGAFTAAYYATLNKTNALAANNDNVKAAAKLDIPDFVKNQTGFEVNPSRDSNDDPTYVEVEVVYPFNTITAYPLPNNLNSMTLRRKVRMTVLPN